MASLVLASLLQGCPNSPPQANTSDKVGSVQLSEVVPNENIDGGICAYVSVETWYHYLVDQNLISDWRNAGPSVGTLAKALSNRGAGGNSGWGPINPDIHRWIGEVIPYAQYGFTDIASAEYILWHDLTGANKYGVAMPSILAVRGSFPFLPDDDIDHMVNVVGMHWDPHLDDLKYVEVADSNFSQYFSSSPPVAPLVPTTYSQASSDAYQNWFLLNDSDATTRGDGYAHVSDESGYSYTTIVRKQDWLAWVVGTGVHHPDAMGKVALGAISPTSRLSEPSSEFPFLEGDWAATASFSDGTSQAFYMAITENCCQPAAPDTDITGSTDDGYEVSGHQDNAQVSLSLSDSSETDQWQGAAKIASDGNLEIDATEQSDPASTLVATRVSENPTPGYTEH